MNKIILLTILSIGLLSCEKDNEDDGCKCTGKFTNDGETFFYGQNVDCSTGSPVIENNPNASYLGCND